MGSWNEVQATMGKNGEHKKISSVHEKNSTGLAFAYQASWGSAHTYGNARDDAWATHFMSSRLHFEICTGMDGSGLSVGIAWRLGLDWIGLEPLHHITPVDWTLDTMHAGRLALALAIVLVGVGL